MNGSIRIVNPTEPLVIEVIKYSIGNATTAKIHAVLEMYKLKDKILSGYYLNNKLVGVLGYKTMQSSALILHLSVLPEFQNIGIGTALINLLKQKYSKIIAETDMQTLEFYSKQGFNCAISYNSKWSGRYECVWQRKNSITIAEKIIFKTVKDT